MMATSPQQCPKCSGRMEQGFILDQTHGGRLVSHWAAGAPLKSLWYGTKTPEGPTVAIGAYRCASCGFLEMYARDEFAAQ